MPNTLRAVSLEEVGTLWEAYEKKCPKYVLYFSVLF